MSNFAGFSSDSKDERVLLSGMIADRRNGVTILPLLGVLRERPTQSLHVILKIG